MIKRPLKNELTCKSCNKKVTKSDTIIEWVKKTKKNISEPGINGNR